MSVAVMLLEKMVPLDKPLQLTLLGISVSDMIKPGGGISSFFAKPSSGNFAISSTDSYQENSNAKVVTKNSNKTKGSQISNFFAKHSSNTDKSDSSFATDVSSERTEPKLQKVPSVTLNHEEEIFKAEENLNAEDLTEVQSDNSKRLGNQISQSSVKQSDKANELESTLETVSGASSERAFHKLQASIPSQNQCTSYVNEIDPAVFAELPPEIQSEIMTTNQKANPVTKEQETTGNNSRKRKAEDDCLSNWDPEVFANLPQDIKDELTANKQTVASQKKSDGASKTRKGKHTSITNFFKKL